jgi:hypothetical protein
LSWDEHAGEIVERMQERAGGAKRAAVEGALYLDRWRRWALPTGVPIATDLGPPPEPLCDALDEHVRDHCERLITDLAG